MVELLVVTPADGAELTDGAKELLGRYIQKGQHCGRSCYERQGGGLAIFWREKAGFDAPRGWWFARGQGEAVAWCAADLEEVPRSGWQMRTRWGHAADADLIITMRAVPRPERESFTSRTFRRAVSAESRPQAAGKVLAAPAEALKGVAEMCSHPDTGEYLKKFGAQAVHLGTSALLAMFECLPRAPSVTGPAEQNGHRDADGLPQPRDAIDYASLDVVREAREAKRELLGRLGEEGVDAEAAKEELLDSFAARAQGAEPWPSTEAEAEFRRQCLAEILDPAQLEAAQDRHIDTLEKAVAIQRELLEKMKIQLRECMLLQKLQRDQAQKLEGARDEATAAVVEAKRAALSQAHEHQERVRQMEEQHAVHVTKFEVAAEDLRRQIANLTARLETAAAEAQATKQAEASWEAARVMRLKKGSFASPAAWGFAVLGADGAEEPSSALANRSYRALMKKLHPDRAGHSQSFSRAMEVVNDAKRVCEQGLSKQELPQTPQNLRCTPVCTTRGERSFRLEWAAPDAQAPTVRRYVVEAMDPACGKSITVSVLEPDYCQEKGRFVGIDELTNYVLSEKELHAMKKFWEQPTATLQVAAVNETGQSKFNVVQVQLAGAPAQKNPAPSSLSAPAKAPPSPAPSSLPTPAKAQPNPASPSLPTPAKAQPNPASSSLPTPPKAQQSPTSSPARAKSSLSPRPSTVYMSQGTSIGSPAAAGVRPVNGHAVPGATSHRLPK